MSESLFTKERIKSASYTIPGNPLAFPPIVEKAVRNSLEGTVENRILKGETVSDLEINQRLNWLWQEHDRNPWVDNGLVALWLQSILLKRTQDHRYRV